jgi:hypothetical protein
MISIDEVCRRLGLNKDMLIERIEKGEDTKYYGRW